MSVCVCKGRDRKLGVQVCVHVLGFWCVVFPSNQLEHTHNDLFTL